MVVIDEAEYLAHYGIIRRSGRYPWGSGGNVAVRSKSFLDYIKLLRKDGLSDTVIAKGVGMSTTQLRALNTIARNEYKQSQIRTAQKFKDKGMSNVAIGERMGLNESSVRSLLAHGAKDTTDILTATSGMLKSQVDKHGFIDVGAGVESHLSISKERLNTSIEMLKAEGYEVHRVKVKQLGTGHETDVKVLGPPGSEQKEIWQDPGLIKNLDMFSTDGGRTYVDPSKHSPIAIDPSRVEVRYAEDGGAKEDGVIQVRPGSEELSMGGARYAQVRIQVGDGHYLKGMAVYKDDMPPGVDVIFNTNKSSTGNKLDAMKELTSDPDLPFGSITRPIVADAGSDKERVTSALNIVNEEGDWSNWSRNLSSQMLSKQSPKLAKEQLDMTFERRDKELNEIMSLTNPAVRKKLLDEFSEGTDAASVHLKAAALPRQATHVILPVNTIPPTEIYAPGYRDGESVVLIRYPHGGTFEIPELRVNNKHRDAKKLLGNARDAIGIHHTVAERLSGADFDGDTVLVIPNSKGKVKTSPALEGLKDFDPQSAYPGYSGMRPMRNTQTEMGKVSNLITDMTIRGASHNELARAVRHSMVVIDAEKHGLNYKLSAEDNGIKQLREKYQTKPDGTSGASTLISRAKSRVYVKDYVDRPYKDGGPVDPKTGERVYKETGKVYKHTNKPVMVRRQALEVAKDAHTLSSGTPIERLYADHSNRLKALANKARLASLNTKPRPYSPSAKRAYANEVASLDSKLTLAKMNAPLERQAQIIANSVVRAKRDAHPDMEVSTRKKIESQALTEARARTGAGKQRIEITPREWDAIQAGAISNSKLTQILDNSNMETVRKLATPKTQLLMTASKTSRAQSMLASGYTRAQVADALGVSLTTLDNATNG